MPGGPRSIAGIFAVIAAVAVAVIAVGLVSQSSVHESGSVRSSSIVADASSATPVADASGEPAASAASSPTPTPDPQAIQGAVRVDQLGFTPDELKVAYLLAAAPADGAAFTVVDDLGTVVLHGTAGPDRGPWNDAWPAVHELDLTDLREPGAYRVVLTGAVAASSPTFVDRLGGRPVRARGSRTPSRSSRRSATGPTSSPGDLARKPSHLNDATLDVFAWPTLRGPGQRRDRRAARLAADRPPRRPRGRLVRRRRLHQVHAHHGLRRRPAVPRRSGAGRGGAGRPRRRGALRRWTGSSRPGTRSTGDAVPPGRHRLGQHSTARSTATTTCGGCPRRDDTLTGAREPLPAHSPGVPRQRTRRAGSRPTSPAGVAAAFALAAQVDAAADPAAGRGGARDRGRGSSPARRPSTWPRPTSPPRCRTPSTRSRRGATTWSWGAPSWRWPAQALGDPRAERWLRDGARWAAPYLDDEAGDDTLNLYDTSARWRTPTWSGRSRGAGRQRARA